MSGMLMFSLNGLKNGRRSIGLRVKVERRHQTTS
ncbi:MAG: hypothetical protein QOF66_2587, partial [Mycobacterium sp.]|nr:hypothetical protein [Mycobacterium sp.]